MAKHLECACVTTLLLILKFLDARILSANEEKNRNNNNNEEFKTLFCVVVLNNWLVCLNLSNLVILQAHFLLKQLPTSNTISYTASYRLDSDQIVFGCQRFLTIPYKTRFGNNFDRKLS